MPEVSVCIPTFNRCALLKETIASVLAQTWADLEVIVCDNASTDNTAQVVAGFADPRLHYHRNQKNVGMADNWNRCVELATGAYVAILSDDDTWAPTFLATTVSVLQQHPDVGVVFTNHYFRIGEAVHVRPQYAAPGLHRHFAELVMRRNPIAMSGSLVRATALGQFLPFLNTPAADYNLWLHLAQSEWGAYYIPEPLMTYRVHEGALSSSRRNMAASALDVLQRHSFTDRHLERVRQITISRVLVRLAVGIRESGGSLSEAVAKLWQAARIAPWNREMAVGLAGVLLPRRLLLGGVQVWGWIKRLRSDLQGVGI